MRFLAQDDPIRLPFVYLRRHKARMASAVLWRCVHLLIPMQLPLLTGAIVDGLGGRGLSFYGLDRPGAAPADVLAWGAWGLLAVALAYGVSAYALGVSRAHLSRSFVTALRKAAFEKLARLSISQHQHHGAAELIDRALSDTGSMRRFLDRVFIQALTNVLRVGYPVAMLLVLDARLALIALSVLPVQWAITRLLQNRLHAATRARRDTRSDLTTAVKEGVDGVETIKMLHAEKRVAARMSETAERLESDELYSSRLSAGISAAVWLITSVGLALTWWQGGLQVIAGEMTVGGLVAFTGFVAFAYQPFRQFTTIINTYRRGLVALERVHDLLTAPDPIADRPGARPLQISEGRVSVEDVRFAYSDEPVLQDVRLDAAPRQLTALVGRSGSGKSSLLRLIARLYDVAEGRILIDGQPIGEVTLGSLRSQVALVPQHATVFSGTVMENLRLARPEATQAEVEAACEAAFALSFIERLEKGFETRIGRGGASLSGGEKQRLALARALLGRPRVLLLDEPTSALDAESEAAVVEALLRMRGERTVIVVGHRLHTIRHADRIYVMDAGRVVEAGTHEALLAHSPLYDELFGTGLDVPSAPIEVSPCP